MHTPRVDVVVPTYNRPERLRRCLEALARQSFRDLHVIVVDDGSSPPVAPALAEEPISNLSISVVRPERNSGVAEARNLGVMAGSAPLVGFIDDDIIAHEDCIGTLVATLDKHPAPAAVMGSARAPDDWRPTPWNLWEQRTLDSIYQRLRRGELSPGWRIFFSGISLLRREDFIAAGGFDARIRRAEDIEFGARLEEVGVTLLFNWDAIGLHYSERSFASWLSIARDYGRLQVVIDALHPRLNWLETVHKETRGATLGRRVQMLSILVPKMADVSAALAPKLAPALCQAGQTTVAMKVLSYTYLTSYARSLREAEMHREATLAPFRGPLPPLPSPAEAKSRIVFTTPPAI